MESDTAIGATVRSMTILEIVADSPEPIGVTAIAEQTGLSKGTVSKHLSTLHELGYVDRSNGHYLPSVRFLDYGIRAGSLSELHRAAAAPIDELAEMTNEVAGIAIEHDGRVVDVYLSTAHADPDFPAYNTRLFHCSAAGKAILAEQSEDELDTLLETPRTERTEYTITAESELRAELDRIRDRGVAFDRQEQFPRVNSVADGISTESVTGAIFVSGWADELSGKRFEENVPGILFSASNMLLSELSATPGSRR
ncbi:IclR family transcriptional regulator [Natrinema ejinorense]|uniref:Transcriptional regulator n=1 Tax=Natrinema ejinorense TaxID=373386 RepID=A0A2A5QYT0_9EURY|nr:IclR family transcriptional regulator [Natrinema ejinorense]PCR91996.1 transcriptional regulator [Natrinema ejinorense]